MIGLEIIKYSLKNLGHRKTRSFLTIVSIFIGISAIFIFASFGLGLYNYVGELSEQSGLDKFMVQPKGGVSGGLDDNFKLTDDDLRTIDKTNGVKFATGMYAKSAEIERKNQRKYVLLIGMPPNKETLDLFGDMASIEVDVGRQLKKGDMNKVVLGYNYRVADRIFSKPLDIGEKITINDEKYEVIGFWEEVGNPQDDSQAYITDDAMKDLYGEDLGYYSIMGSVVNAVKIDDTLERVEKNLRKKRDLEEGKEDFFVQSLADAFEMFTSVINIVVGFIFLIVIISALVASINTANTMVTSVLERIKEIGIMKSMGAKNSTIRDLFLFESAYLGSLAGIIGVLIGWGLAALGGNILSNLGWSFLKPIFPWWLFAFCILLAIVVGAISGVFPAVHASKQKPVDALRYE